MSGTSRPIAAAAVVAVALAAAGCGGSKHHGLTKVKYGKQLNAICASTVQKAGRPRSLPELVSKGPKLLAAFDKALPQAEALEPPKELKPDVDKFLDEYKHLRVLVGELIDSAKKGDLETAVQIAGEAEVIGRDAGAQARKLGAPACAPSLS